MKNSYLFISDIHLGLQAKDKEEQKEKLLVEFLSFAQTNAKELFILGDLFDYWFEYRHVYPKGYYRTLTALKDVAESGTKIHYLFGNHDFYHRNFFKDEIGAELYGDPLDITIDGKKFFLAHGDGLLKNDIGYKLLKKVLRNKFFQWMFSLVHPDIGIALASATSKTSREYTSQKNYGEIDGMFEAAKLKIDEGFDFVIFGHSHTKSFCSYNNGYYINLGSWIGEPAYGYYENGEFKIIDWK